MRGAARAPLPKEANPMYYGKTIVIKYGGSAMISRELREAVIGDVILLSLVGIHVVVVHGGGPEISAMLKKLGKESRFVDGLRCTDAETMDVVQQVLCGKVNKNLAATLNRRGGRAIGLCGLDAGLFQARLLDAKYGLVGELARVDPAPVRDCLTAGYIPVVSTVAQGVDGENAYNINADTAAARLAVALGAEHPSPEGGPVRGAPAGAGGGHPGRHDSQGGVLRGGGALRRGAHPHPGRSHPPLHSHRAALRRGHRHHDPVRRRRHDL